MKKLLVSALVVGTMLLFGCGGSSSQVASATSGMTPDRGPQAPAGVLVPAGQRKIGQYVWVSEKFVIPPYIGVDVYADCPANHVVTGGGYDVESGALVVTATKPNSAFDRWVILGLRNHSDYIKLTVYAACAPIK
jgi:hypothetical protein